MNNRDYKEFAPGNFYHIFNRGNNKEKIFFDEKDYKVFLFRLGLSLGFEEEELNKNNLTSVPYARIRITETNKSNFKLHAFCLMPNHFHLLIEQCKDKTISGLISKTCTSYSKYINKKYRRVGHLFQDQFKSVLVEDNPQLMWTSSYIHMNPVKDGFVNSPEKYEWSSYRDFIGERNLPIISKDLLIETFDGRSNFKKETLNYDKNKENTALPRAVLGSY